ncbi:MAG: response regulator, partial [Aeromonas sp.]
MNVLICDDSALARKQLARSLPADWPVTVHFAEHGVAGVEQVLMGNGEVIFLDLTMPELDGYGVLETLKR